MISNPPMRLKVTYGSGEIEGVHVYEDVYFGDLKAPQMSLYLIVRQTTILDDVSNSFLNQVLITFRRLSMGLQV